MPRSRVTLGLLLKDPRLALRVVSASENLGRAVRRCVWTSAVDPSPWLEGDDLVLTDGQQFEHDSRAQADFVRHVDSTASAGIVIATTGLSRRRLSALASTCAAVELPLLAVDTKDELAMVKSAVEDGHTAAVSGADTVSADIVGAFASGLGVDGVLQALAHLSPGTVAILRGPYGERFAPPSVPISVWDDAARVVDDAVRRRSLEPFVHGNQTWLARSVTVTGAPEAWMLVMSTRSNLTGIREPLTVAARCLQLDLGSIDQVRHPIRTRFASLLDRAQHDPHQRSDVRLGLERLGAELDQGFKIAALRPLDSSARVLGQLCAAVERELAAYEAPIVTISEDAVIALVRGPDLPLHRLTAQLGRNPDVGPIVFGLSYTRVDPRDVADALDEALSAASGSDPGGPYEVHERGLPSIAAYLSRRFLAGEFSRASLGAIRAYDATSEGKLEETLRAFYAADFNMAATAESLYIQRHTLNYRLRQVAELTGINPRSAAGAFQFQLALQL
jgi:hypothetical protein